VKAGTTRRRLFIAIALFFPLLLVALAEYAVRARYPYVSALAVLVPSKDVLESMTGRTSVFAPDARCCWRLRPDLKAAVWDFTLVSTNHQGLRLDEEVPPKVPGGIRVVCAGDSVTFGYRVPVYFPESPGSYEPGQVAYFRLLKEALARANPGRPVHVVPLAVPGYSTVQGLRQQQRELARYQPDLVTLLYGWNDISVRDVADVDAMPDDWPHYLAREALVHSQLLTHLALHFRRSEPPPVATEPPPRVSRETYVANMLAMAQLATSLGARVIIIAPVYGDKTSLPGEWPRMHSWRDALGKAAENAKIPYLLIPELTEAWSPGNESFFGEVIHPSYLGHQLITERLLKFIRERGLLPGVKVPDQG
jgi:lysophospholipase L1-like esterase